MTAFIDTRTDLRRLLAAMLVDKDGKPIPALLPQDTAPANNAPYVRLSGAGMGDVYDFTGPAYYTPRFQVDIWVYGPSDSEPARLGALAEGALNATKQWRISHPRPPLGFEGQADVNKFRWYTYRFDCETIA